MVRMAIVCIMIPSTFAALAISAPNSSAAPDYPIMIPPGEGDLGIIKYENTN